jgi:hypothetical protein
MIHRHHLVSKSFMVLPAAFVSTGNPYPSMFEGRWCIEGLVGRYVNAQDQWTSDNFDMTLCQLGPTRGSMCIYPRISCGSYLLEIAKAS